MEYCNIFIAEYQYNQYNNNIIVPSAGIAMWKNGIFFNNSIDYMIILPGIY